jgi:hypothetical protein
MGGRGGGAGPKKAYQDEQGDVEKTPHDHFIGILEDISSTNTGVRYENSEK